MQWIVNISTAVAESRLPAAPHERTVLEESIMPWILAAAAQGSLCKEAPRNIPNDPPQVSPVAQVRHCISNSAPGPSTAAGRPGSALLLWCLCRRIPEASMQTSELPDQRQPCKHKHADPNVSSPLSPAKCGGACLAHDTLSCGEAILEENEA